MQHFHKASVNIKYICFSLGVGDICQILIPRNRVTLMIDTNDELNYKDKLYKTNQCRKAG